MRLHAGPAITVALLAGVAGGIVSSANLGAALAAAVAALSVLPVARGQFRTAVLLAAVAALATAHGAAARDRVIGSPLLVWFDRLAPSGSDPRDVPVFAIEGYLLDDAAPSEAGVRLLLAVTRVGDGRTWEPVRGRVQAHVAGGLAAGHLAAWTRGRPIRAPVLLRRPQVFRNFGGPDERLQQLRRPFDLSATIKSAALVTVEPGRVWHEAAARVRRYVREVAARRVAPYDPQAAAIAVAILIGDRAGLDASVERRLQIAGTYHVIAISGGNIALLTALCVLVCRGMVRSAAMAPLLPLFVVVTYGGIVGGDPSVARAVLAASLYLTATALGVRPRPLHLLCTVAAAIAIVDPLMVIDVGAWLSFGATLGIILGVARMAAAIRRAGPMLRLQLPGLASIGRVLMLMGLASIAAELMLLPIAATVFNRVGAAGLALNFAAIPAMAIVQIAGLATVALDWAGPIASVPAGLCAAGARVLVRSADLLVLAPWLSWRVPPPAIWWIGLYYGAALAAVVSPRARRVAVPVAAVALVVIVAAPRVTREGPPPGVLRLVMFDVGQGDAMLLQFPSGHAMLVDAGGTTGAFDLGGRVVTPAIWAQQVRRLDALAITHPDRDHIGGAASVAADLAPREIWEGVPIPRNVDRATLRDLARRADLIWRHARAGEGSEFGGVSLDVLHPPPPDWERQRVRNDDSLVLRVRYGDVELLLTGDAGAEFERGATSPVDAAPIRILKAGHHGSRTSSSPGFVRAYRPDVVLISAGRGNLFGHPAPEVLARFAAVEARIFRTDRDGAIRIETDGRVVHVETADGRRWTTGVLRLS